MNTLRYRLFDNSLVLVEIFENNEWSKYCVNNQKESTGYLLEGIWNVGKSQFQFIPNKKMIVCQSSAMGKCISWGHGPKTSVRRYNACIKMVRADYCGNGISFTIPGQKIFYEYFYNAFQDNNQEKFPIEAIWTEQGATCIQKARLPDRYSFEYINTLCLTSKGKIIPYCKDEHYLIFDGPVFVNW